MLDLHQMQRAFAHDPLRRSDRKPAGAVPAGTVVSLLLRVEKAARADVKKVWLEVLDPSYASEHAVSSVSVQEESCDAQETASRNDQWIQIPAHYHPEGYVVEVPTGGEPRVIFYRFRIQTFEAQVLFVRRPDGMTTSGIVYALDSKEDEDHIPPAFQLTIYDPAFKTPAWFSGGLMYQIFPDRFARGEGGVLWDGVESHKKRGWPIEVHENWNEPPAWGESYDPVDFFGGTLEGIEENLDYLESLGVSVVYLNPICEARSNHRYNTGDYEQVDPILGSWEDLERLSTAAAERGIKIVLDTVLSHTGAASKYFNADGSYDSLGAAQSEESPYRDWYVFNDEGQVPPYRCWWNDPTLPEVEECNASWQSFMLGEGENESSGVIGGWIGHGVSGLRLDVADEIPDEALEKVRESAKRAWSDTVVIGEVWEDPTTKESYGSRRTYALGRSLDSVMNYPLRAELIQFILGNTTAQQFTTFLKFQKSNYPRPMYRSLMNLLSSHDVERIRSVLALGREFRDLDRNSQADIVSNIDWQADARAANLQRILATLLYMMPGVPCIYYGDERGMHGGRDPFDRATFPWNGGREDCGRDLTAFYQELGRLRNSYKVLRHGFSAFYSYSKDVVCILRTPGERSGEYEAFLCVANRSSSSVSVVIDLVEEAAGLPLGDLFRVRYSDVHPRCVFDTTETAVDADLITNCEDGIFKCTIGPEQACVFRLTRGFGKPMERGVGVISHITSVPNEDAAGNVLGQGTLGAPGKKFVDHLAESGVKYWQVLPLNPTDEYGSPYAGLSAFAGNVHLLEPDHNVEIDEAEYAKFVESNEEWLLPYATFVAVKKVVGELPWQEWPEKYRDWSKELAELSELASHVEDECRNQFVFEQQWRELREYANERGIKVIGDMPIYVSADSADVWSHKNYFALDAHGNVASQSGVPPDAFAPEGQLWGNPTYRWDVLRKHGYDWWMQRLKRMFDWYDYVRIDHFVGFSSYFSIPAGATPAEGKWLPGPGFDFFKHAQEQFDELPLLAEDLGTITPEVRRLLAQTGFPGMDVVLFADGDPTYDWKPKLGKITYTSTHDTSTLVGWAKSRYCSGEDEEASLEKAKQIARFLENKAVASTDGVVMMQLQDVLELDDSSRMNVPGTAGENWHWQAKQADVDESADRLAQLASMR